MVRLCLLALCAAGCTFSVAPLDLGWNGAASPSDLAGAATSYDLGATDLASAAGDLAPGFVPAHVDPGYWHPGAIDLSGVTTIDTSSLTINGSPPPTGISFVAASGHATDWAVLSVGGWSVGQPVTVTGARALIVIASKPIDVAAIIDVSGNGFTPGPGGQNAGAGAGGPGLTSGDSDGGGGGAGFATPAIAGGDSDNPGAAPGGTAGAGYGPALAFFGGGSGGGNGGSQARCTDLTKGRGGGGGGAIQLSSSVSISVEASGGINAGGGGGTGGCGSVASAGGGGGSGGLIFIEAPTLFINGKLAANGGGGGGGGSGNGNNDGTGGGNGALSTTAAGGGSAGPGGGLFSPSDGAGGGSGAVGGTAPTRGGSNVNGGGSGGATGRIWLRTRGGTPTIGASSLLSPGAMTDATL